MKPFKERYDMTFEKKLFEEIRSVFPNITTRTFSVDCGKSEGYYSSITAQNLSISDNALIHLAEVLECRAELMHTKTPERLAKVTAIQQMIAEEIGRRTHDIDSESAKIRTMILSALARTSLTRDRTSWAMPVVMG